MRVQNLSHSLLCRWRRCLAKVPTFVQSRKPMFFWAQFFIRIQPNTGIMIKFGFGDTQSQR